MTDRHFDQDTLDRHKERFQELWDRGTHPRQRPIFTTQKDEAFAAWGRLMALKTDLQEQLKRFYPENDGDPIKLSDGETFPVIENAELAAAIETIKNAVFTIYQPQEEVALSKSHAQRLVKALCALIDARLPR